MVLSLMKRMKLVLFVAVIVLALGTSSMVYGYSTTNSVTLKMTIFNSAFVSVTNVNGSGSELDYLTMVANTTNGPGTTRATFMNNGTGQEDFSVRAEVTNAGITLVSGTPANNQIRVWTIFAEWSGTHVKTDFLTDDILTTSYQAASSTVFAKSGDPANLKGYDIPAAAGNESQRNMFFCINPGTVTTSGTFVKVKIWIRAQAG